MDDGGLPGRIVGEDGERVVEIRDSAGVIIGDGNTQINYTYNALAVTGGVAPPPMISVSGVVESPYRGLNAYEDGEEAFFFGRDTVTSEILKRLTSRLPEPGILVVSGVSGAGSLLCCGLGWCPGCERHRWQGDKEQRNRGLAW